MADSVKLSGLVICRNNAATIARCLRSMAFCDEIVVVDGFSDDGTYEKAQALATTVEQHRFDHFGAQRARSHELARGEWLFFLDSDEEASEELGDEIKELLRSDITGLPAGFMVRRRFHYPPVWKVPGCYWQGSIRLFRRSAGRWDPEKLVHEGLEFSGRTGKLSGIIEHWPWDGLDDVITRSVSYSAMAARDLARRGKGAGAVTATGHALARFLRHYLRDGGWRRGTAGFFFSAALALEPFLKYARAWELKKIGAAEEEKPPEESPEKPPEEKQSEAAGDQPKDQPKS